MLHQLSWPGTPEVCIFNHYHHYYILFYSFLPISLFLIFFLPFSYLVLFSPALLYSSHPRHPHPFPAAAVTIPTSQGAQHNTHSPSQSSGGQKPDMSPVELKSGAAFLWSHLALNASGIFLQSWFGAPFSIFKTHGPALCLRENRTGPVLFSVSLYKGTDGHTGPTRLVHVKFHISAPWSPLCPVRSQSSQVPGIRRQTSLGALIQPIIIPFLFLTLPFPLLPLSLFC